MRKLNSREVRRAFREDWRETTAANPELRTDKPAKRFAFSCFVDSLERSGRISEGVAQRVTLEGR